MNSSVNKIEEALRVSSNGLPGAHGSSDGGGTEDGGGTARAIIFAGGRGTRLAPFTSVLPKPLMPIGDRSILELVIKQLAECGIGDVTLCVGYLSHLIEAVIGDGAEHGVDVSVRARAGGTRHGRSSPPRRGSRRNVHRHERRRADDAPLLRPATPTPGVRKHRHDRDAGAADPDRLRRPARSRDGKPGLQVHREAPEHVDRQHGHLRPRARGARLHP